MTARHLALVLVLSLGGAWIASACLVDRKSDDLKCSLPSDCTAPRVCEGGYCVVDANACPAECVSCDKSVTPHVCKLPSGTGGSNFTCPTGIACEITCTGSSTCNNITCNTGSTCTITCTGGSSCSDVTCNGTTCNIMCIGGSACDNVTCGSGRCIVDCSTDGSCASVHCANACACDVTCGTAAACGGILCPRLPANKYCTASQVDGEPCISSAPQCDKC
jgi:hypothetical protein